jgi:hypothetical protein
MLYVFTVCSNNYLAQAIVLGNSLKKHHPTYQYIIFLVDEKNEIINYEQIGYELIPVHLIEPDLEELVLKYELIELNTALKPKVIEYLFKERAAQNVIYLDPDIKVFSPLSEIEEKLKSYPVLLTPHIYTPILKDGYSPQENLFLNYGLYNLGFIGLSKSEESFKLIKWWKE